MNNLEIRQAILKTGAKQWRIAEKLGISESSFSKLLRKELSEEKKKKFWMLLKASNSENFLFVNRLSIWEIVANRKSLEVET